MSDSRPKIRSNKKHQAEVEALFNSIGEGAITTDEFGKITRANPVALELLGYDESELVGNWFPKVVMAVNFDNQPINLIDRPITKAFLTGKPISEKLYYRHKNGDNIPVAVNVSPIILDDKPLGAIEVFRDVTHDHEVDKMKSEFISLASHQLRTPLSAIKTYTHMLYDGYIGELTTDQKKSLKTVIGATNRMNELISTLLNVTRIESGSIAMNKKTVDVSQVTEEIIEELALNSAVRSIDMKLTTKPKSSIKVTTDLLIFKEILTNLIANAIKYTPEKGEVHVSIRARPVDVLFEVRDNGWGIPEASQDQVFSKFFRAQNIVKRETTGTGLGLYLVKALVEALGGTIWFESVEGEGSSFYFTIPCKKSTTKGK